MTQLIFSYYVFWTDGNKIDEKGAHQLAQGVYQLLMNKNQSIIHNNIVEIEPVFSDSILNYLLSKKIQIGMKKSNFKEI